jgi:hypothetical protein
MYVNKLVAALPRVEFQCLVVGPQVAAVDGANPFTDREEEFTEFLGNRAGADGDGEGEGEEEGEGGEGVMSGRVSGDGEGGAVAGGGAVEVGIEGKGVMYDALVLQLGSFFRYALYSPASQPPRKQGKCVSLSYVTLLSVFYEPITLSSSFSSPAPSSSTTATLSSSSSSSSTLPHTYRHHPSSLHHMNPPR